MSNNKPRIIAFYLPQFHPTPHNNEWYGKGFTEWTNVAKAKKLFWGHEQPHIPADLGFYDLRLGAVREEQAKLAKEAGIEGFCYYHYWFAPNEFELELPFNEVLKSGKPDFPFMLCWANETWQKKFWNIDGSIEKHDLRTQTYGGAKDYEQHFYDVLPAFKDNRYIKIDNKPAFMIYKPLNIPDLKIFTTTWNKLAKENGFDGVFFIGQSINADKEKKTMLEAGINIVNSVRHYDNYSKRSVLIKVLYKAFRIVFRLPVIKDYKKIYKTFVTESDRKDDMIPTIIPNWDHTPRSGRGGYVIKNSQPRFFKKHVHQVFDAIKNKNQNRQIAFLKSWNEWGEGNYMEPDLKYGKQYIEVLKEEIDTYRSKQ